MKFCGAFAVSERGVVRGGGRVLGCIACRIVPALVVALMRVGRLFAACCWMRKFREKWEEIQKEEREM